MATPQAAISVVFRRGIAYAQQGDQLWAIAEVSREQMLWAPDGYRFAYVKQRSAPATQPTTQPSSVSPGGKSASRPASTAETEAPALHHIVIRNIRGDSVNEFPVYRPGAPAQLDWVDDDTLAYLAPPDKSGDAYVLHSVSTGEVLRVFRGQGFIWSPGRKHLAYVTTARREQRVKVNDRVVWPRTPVAAAGRRKGGAHRRVLGELVWSPDGSGLAFITVDANKPVLVVLLVVDNADGDLTWPLPKGATEPENRVFWAESKVVIGQSMLKPRFAASWNRVQ